MDRKVTVELGGFTWERLQSEAERQGVSIEELVAHAVLYFLADFDSGRIARRIPPRDAERPQPEASKGPPTGDAAPVSTSAPESPHSQPRRRK